MSITTSPHRGESAARRTLFMLFFLVVEDVPIVSGLKTTEGITYRNVFRKSSVAPASASRIIGVCGSRSVRVCMIQCFAMDGSNGCWGVECTSFKNNGSNVCRFIRGTGVSDYATLAVTPSNSSTAIFWLAKAGKCGLPQGYGNFAQFPSSTPSRGIGDKLPMTCKKGSAFNKAQLRSVGYNATIEQQFGAINLTCGKNGTWYPLPADVPQCQDLMECRRTAMGKEYMGTKNVTAKGSLCINWANQTWNTSSDLTSDSSYPNGTLTDQKNYCRNPTRDARPWCFVANPLVVREDCDIPMCQDTELATLECKLTLLGKDYLGTKNTTVSGGVCDKWQNWMLKDYQSHLTDNGANVITTACRNPLKYRDSGSVQGPWCWTSYFLNVWGYCDVSFCPGFP